MMCHIVRLVQGRSQSSGSIKALFVLLTASGDLKH